MPVALNHNCSAAKVDFVDINFHFATNHGFSPHETATQPSFGYFLIIVLWCSDEHNYSIKRAVPD